MFVRLDERLGKNVWTRLKLTYRFANNAFEALITNLKDVAIPLEEVVRRNVHLFWYGDVLR